MTRIYFMDKKSIQRQYRTWLEINTKAIKNNYQAFRSLIAQDCKLCGVVKSNAYGHGLVDFSKQISRLGIDFLAVDSITEGLCLRKKGIKTPILVLGYTLPSLLKKAAINDLSLTISSFEALNNLKQLGKIKIKIHLKIDTGMHRQGFFYADRKKVFKFLKDNRNIILEGAYTHFAMAKNPVFPEETNKQIELFKKWKEEIKKQGYNPLFHCAATAGTILYPKAHFDMVRVGIGLYGLWPAKEVKAFAQDNLKLLPVMTWKTVVSEIKILEKGEKIGYDFTEKMERRTKVAVLPIGYWHGYPRSLSGIGRVLIKDKFVKVLGRISMDMITCDVTNITGLEIGDEVVLLGLKKGKEVNADDLANLADTTNYEFVTRINPLIKKVYKAI